MRNDLREPVFGFMRLRAFSAVVIIVSVFTLTSAFSGCATSVRPPKNAKKIEVVITATGYDSGKESCGWKRNWFGRPVYAYGKMKGKPKKVGITASGVRAQRGTIAADAAFYPFGTVMHVPGYGYGVVEDRGGAIKGRDRIDLWFPTREEALRWGRRKIKVSVYVPNK